MADPAGGPHEGNPRAARRAVGMTIEHVDHSVLKRRSNLAEPHEEIPSLQRKAQQRQSILSQDGYGPSVLQLLQMISYRTVNATA